MSSMPVLGGRYRLLNRLGGGGMSVVWRGYDEVLGRTVAVKLLAGHAGGTDQAASRELVLAEARTAAQLSHPHICQVYDYGESQIESGEYVPYLVMELLSGWTLAERLRAGPMPVRVAVQVCAQVASALAAAHSRGLVHRDIKPANIMMTPTGPKVVDFGIAATAGATDEPADGEMVGTPAYLAPERLMGGEVKPASDVYALGLVLYRMVSGAAPWRAETVTEMLEAHQYREPAPLPPVAGLPEAVADLCARCLAKNPRERPAAADLARLLAEAEAELAEQAEEPDEAGPATSPPADAETPAGGTAPGRHVRDDSRRRLVLLVTAAVVCLVAVIAGGVLTADTPTTTRPGPEVAAAPGDGDPSGDPPATDPAAGDGTSNDPLPGGGVAGPTGAGNGAPFDPPGQAGNDAGGAGPDRPPAPGAPPPPAPVPGASGAPVEPAPEPVEDTVETDGGTVRARCDRTGASVAVVQLAPGFRVVEETRGPGVVRAGIVLGSSDSEVRVNLRCQAGEPIVTVETS